MPHYLSDEEMRRTAPAELASFRSPVPTQIVSNGEFNPLPQTREQQRVEARIKALSEELGPRHGMGRREFLASSAGMAAADCSTGEQKALLVALVLAHAHLVAEARRMIPLVLLDEIAAHLDRARREALFERLLALRNDVGLLPEECDTKGHRMVGNFPQAFSHVALVNTAHNLSRATKPAEQRSAD